MKALLLTLFILATALPARAQIFKLTLVPTGNAAVDAALEAELLKVQNDVNKDLPASSPKRLMEGMADSQAASSRGMATDYISHFDKFTIGAGVGLGADLEEDKEMDSDISGAGATGGAIVGLNMSSLFDDSFLGLDPKKTTLMLNFFKYDLEKDVDDNEVKADMISFGFMGSYKWIDGNGSRWFGWDGVRLHTGYQYSSLDLTVTSNIDKDVDEDNGTESISGNLAATPKATIETATHSIPIEISSGVNFLHVLSFYAGLGTDFNMGSAKGKADANAERSTLNCTGGVCGGGQAFQVDTAANVDETGKVRPLFLRAFAGFQVNIPYVRVYAVANKVFGTEVYSVATGLRLAF